MREPAVPASSPADRRICRPPCGISIRDLLPITLRSLSPGTKQSGSRNAQYVVRAAESARDPQLFDFAVNPGHYLHLDEWVHSPFYPDSGVVLKSGMALQMDIIPVSKGPFCYANAEDGVVPADADLQTELERRDPAMWQRVVRRRRSCVKF